MIVAASFLTLLLGASVSFAASSEFGVQSSELKPVEVAEGTPSATSSPEAELPTRTPSEEPATPRNSEELQETLVVTATRVPTRIDETTGSTLVVSRDDLDRAAAPTLDDELRQVPGFTLFRRSGSRTANPTSQGVSLRGVGASGASRALVLDDGVPLNDPFGGWVYWNRVARDAVDRVEVVRGGGSELYGSSSLGGVIQLFRRGEAGESLSFSAAAGSLATRDATLYAAGDRGRWSAALGANLLETGGYVPVAPQRRGVVDVPADAASRFGEVTLGRSLGEGGRLFVRGSRFIESRTNGTRLQVNDTASNQLVGGVDHELAGGSVSFRTWATDQKYHQTFSSIGTARASEQLTRDQRVSAASSGASVQWFRALRSHTLVVGGDGRAVAATNDETVLATGALQRSEGRQETAALFAELLLDLGERWSATVGARIDAWRNVDATVNGIGLADRDSRAFTPRISVRYSATDDVAIFGSAYKAFRAPTLNELYRSFRVGNVLTQANENLDAERLTGYELGFSRRHVGGSTRLNLFDLTIDDPIANVTLQSTPQLVMRQRQNLGETRTLGLELDLEQQIASALSVSGSYLLTDARVQSFSADRAIEGNRLPHTPRQQLTGSLKGTWRRYDGAFEARWHSSQFEDDRNELRLDEWTTFDVFLGAAVRNGLRLFVAGENVAGERYEIGRAGVVTLGAPRSIRVGVRWTSG